MTLSHFAWAVLDQLSRGNVWDGDLVCKSGRTELVEKGLAKRDRVDERGLAVNELTSAGFALAAQFLGDYRPVRH